MFKTVANNFRLFFCFLMIGFLSSCGNDSTRNIDIPGVTGPIFKMDQDNVVILTNFEAIAMDGSLKYNIPKLKYSMIDISPGLDSQGTDLTVSLSLKDLFENKNLILENQFLPGGRNIPGVFTGKLPAIAFSIENFKGMKIYLSDEYFGIFYPHDLGISQAIASFRYYQSKKAIGTISLIGSDDHDENAGILLLIKLDDSIKKQLEKIHKKY